MEWGWGRTRQNGRAGGGWLPPSGPSGNRLLHIWSWRRWVGRALAQRPPETTVVRKERDRHVTRDAGQTIGRRAKKGSERLVRVAVEVTSCPPELGCSASRLWCPTRPMSGVGM